MPYWLIKTGTGGPGIDGNIFGMMQNDPKAA